MVLFIVCFILALMCNGLGHVHKYTSFFLLLVVVGFFFSKASTAYLHLEIGISSCICSWKT